MNDRSSQWPTVLIAALAIEYRAKIITYDTDFARFSRVSWSTPASVDA